MRRTFIGIFMFTILPWIFDLCSTKYGTLKLRVDKFIFNQTKKTYVSSVKKNGTEHFPCIFTEKAMHIKTAKKGNVIK